MKIPNITLALLFVIVNGFAVEDKIQKLTEFYNNSINTQDIPILNHTKGGVNDIAFAVDVHGVIINGEYEPYESYVHALDDFDHITSIAENPRSNLRPYSLEWNQEMTKVYGISRTTPRILISINPTTGVSTEIANFNNILPNNSLRGIAIDENNRCYIVAVDNDNHDTVSTLYECDLETAELTLIGTQSLAPDIHDITASCDGMLYGTDATKESLFSINKQNGEATLIGSLASTANDSYFSMTYDRKSGTIYQYSLAASGLRTAFANLNKETGEATIVSQFYKSGNFVGASKSKCPEALDTFNISPGLNGAWYNPETSGQGFLFDIYPVNNTFFGTWFTFDLTTPEKQGGITDFGSPQQRWFAAQGELGDGNSVELTIYSNSAGIFDNTTPVQTDAVGTMIVSFEDCTKGQIEYVFDKGDVAGVIPIKRIASDNVTLCESLSK